MKKCVYTIPPEEPFIGRLAEGLWTQAERDPFKLSEMLVLLPTRRAGRYLREAFVRIAGRAALLPRMQPLGDLDEDELYFAGDLNPDIPPAITPLRRQLLLARLVRRRDPDMPLDQAAQLAEALGDLLDQVQIERKDFSNLAALAPENLAAHWQQTVKFLEIVTEAWPKMLAEEGCIDPADRRNRVIEAQAASWRSRPPAYPVIAAGSTGSLPATGDLLAVIAELPQGAVILPGLDQELDEEAWQAIEENHPQHSMKSWLEKCSVKRSEVKLWLFPPSRNAEEGRVRLLQESMRPAEVSEGWRALDDKKIPRAALEGLSLLTLDNAQEEAQAIALLMREALEVPGKTAALVTADRSLAERVAQELARWKIKIDDSAGASLAGQPAGSFLLDVLAASAPDASPIDYLSLLKHPLAACGHDPALCRSRARAAELSIWRAARRGDESKEIRAWWDRLKEKFDPLTQNWRKLRPLEEWIDRHLEVAEQLAASDAQTGPERLWTSEAGEAAATWLSDWRSAAHGFPPLNGEDYTNLFAALVRAVKVPATYGLHPRLNIFGLLEARLIQPDLVILGGLNEGIWPPEPAIDPWMSRPMKKRFGLPLPEWRIGLSAHDFVQLASSPEVVLTRSRRAGNAPTVPSRFLLQLETVLRALGYRDDDNNVRAPDKPWADWARQLDEPAKPPKPCAPPEPRPGVRPRALNVTQIGLWRRNPYAIYARWILDLKKLEPLEGDATAADKGLAIHKALDKFLRKFPDRLPPRALDELLVFGREVFAPYRDEPQMAFWWPRFEHVAGWFVETEQNRRAAGIKNIASEAEGALVFADDFVLKGRADRIDRLPGGALAIIDYKTGHVPSQAEVTSGFEPQLPLLALIASEGGFKNLPAAPVTGLAYWKLSGGAEPGEEKPVREPADNLMKAARAGLENLIARFADPSAPYLAVPRPGLQSRYDDYAHLARIKEWGRPGDEA